MCSRQGVGVWVCGCVGVKHGDGKGARDVST